MEVGEGHDVAHRHRPVGERREDRVDRAAPAVEGEQLSGKHHGARLARQGAIEVVPGVAPGRGHALPQQLLVQRVAAHQRPGRRHEQGQAGAGERDPGHPAPGRPPRRHPPPQSRRAETAQPGEAESHERPGLVGRAQEVRGLDVVVGEVQRAAQRGPLGKADGHHERPGEHESEEERAVALPARAGEAAEREGGHEQRGGHHQRGEQQRARVGEVRARGAVETHPDVAHPVAHQAQRLAHARGVPDRPLLLGELEEVDPVARLHEDRRDPPQRRGECQPGRAQRERAHGAPGHAGKRGLVRRRAAPGRAAPTP